MKGLMDLKELKELEELKHLKRLSSVKSGTGIKFLTPAVSPGSHCPMRIASVIVKDIQGLSSLLVGTQECATHSRLFNPHPEGRQGELHWLYTLSDQEVVFGCREGLRDALKKMDQAGARGILLIATCIPELIGEDMEGIIQEIQPELSARVTYVMLGQFKNFSHPPGSWKTMKALGLLTEKKATDSRRINVLGRAPEEDHIPEPSLLPELVRQGIHLSYIAPGASLEDLQRAGDAALNLVVSPYTQPLAVQMQQELGIPYVSLHHRYAVQDIDQAYGDIAQRFGLSWGDAFAEERRRALALEHQAQQRLGRLRFVCAPRVDLPIPLSVYLTGLGMEPLLLHLEEYYPEDKDHARELITRGYDPLICRMVNEEAELPILQKLNPDLCFGYMSYTDIRIPCVANMMDYYGQVGYERTRGLLTRILGVAAKVDAKENKGNKEQGGMAYGTASV